jgi:hypothetical protein
MALTDNQKEAFWRDGFLAVPHLLSRDEVAALKKRTARIILGEVAFPSEFIQIEPEIEKSAPRNMDPVYRVRKMWNLTRHDPVFQE